jgi:hypothetical protein
MKNYKAHYILFCPGLYYEVIALRPALFVIEEDEQCCNGGELRAREVR